nr:tyrosine-type recombinase/integrase [Enterovirga sp. DB1703]
MIGILFEACHITIRAQLAAEWSTGARVSSIVYGARLCDLIMAPGREQIIFRDTKNGKDVAAALHPAAARVMRDYLTWRGGLHDREAPLFLTYKHRPYEDNGKAWGGQNKTGFKAAKRRARLRLLKEAFASARQHRKYGQRQKALDALLQARADARLLRKVTQHWFRHMLATRMAHRDLRGTMEQGGWTDHRSVMGYVHDVSERRRGIVSGFEDFDTNNTRGTDTEAASS